MAHATAIMKTMQVWTVVIDGDCGLESFTAASKYDAYAYLIDNLINTEPARTEALAYLEADEYDEVTEIALDEVSTDSTQFLVDHTDITIPAQ